MDAFRKVKVAEIVSHDRQLSQRGREEATTDSVCEGNITLQSYTTWISSIPFV